MKLNKKSSFRFMGEIKMKQFKCEGYIPLYTHPVKDINEAIEIIKDFQNSDVPPCKDYENTYADGWMDACNEILWAIEEKAQEK